MTTWRELQKRLAGKPPGDAWRKLGFEPPVTMADHKPYAEFVLAHSPGHADLVIAGMPLVHCLKHVMELTGCRPGCGHRMLSPAEQEQLAERLADRE